MTSALPFTVHARTPDPIAAGVRPVRARYEGIARLTDAGLQLEWSGPRDHTDAGSEGVAPRSEPLSVARLTLPPRSIREAVLHRLWWRPYLRLQVNDVDALAGFPVASGTEARLRIAPEDRQRASGFLTDLRLLLADAELRSAAAASAAVDVASEQSFPASDPPAFNPIRIGEPGSHPESAHS